MVVLLQRTCLGNSVVLGLALVLNSHLFQNCLEHRQELHSGLLDETELEVADDADLCERLLLN
jgi:hypothetical protein